MFSDQLAQANHQTQHADRGDQISSAETMKPASSFLRALMSLSMRVSFVRWGLKFVVASLAMGMFKAAPVPNRLNAVQKS